MIENFLDKKLKTKFNTRKAYNHTIKNYFKIINKDMKTYFTPDKPLDEYETDIQKVYMKQEKERKAIITRKCYFSMLKLFFAYYDKRTKDLEIWASITGAVRGAEPESDELIVGRNDIKTLISHGNTLQHALLLMLASSGRRIGELLALYPEDVDITVTPATLNIKRTYDHSQPNKVSQTTKTKQRTTCFISEEAKNAYVEWMKERDDYLRNAVKKVDNCIDANEGKTNLAKKDPHDRRVFPMSYNNSVRIWNNLLVKSGYAKRKDGSLNLTSGIDEKNHRSLFHPHCLRKHFRSYLGDADLAEHLMGHATMMTRAYRQKKPEDLAKDYLKHMQNVTFFENTSKDVEELRKSDKEKDKRIQELENKMAQLEYLLSFKKGFEQEIEQMTKRK